MMKKGKVLLMMVFVLLISACNGKTEWQGGETEVISSVENTEEDTIVTEFPTELESETELEILKEDKEKIVALSQKEYDSNGILSNDEVFEYNEDGNVIKSIYRSFNKSDGEIESVIKNEYHYYTDGQLMKQISTTIGSEDTLLVLVKEYDEDGNVIGYNQNLDSNVLNDVDKMHLYSETTYNEGKTNGCNIFKEDGSLYASYVGLYADDGTKIGNSCTYYTEYGNTVNVYDNYGNLIKRVRDDDISEVKFEYNSDGDVIGVKRYDAEENIISQTVYEYEYDQDGLIMKQVSYINGGYGGYIEYENVTLKEYISSSHDELNLNFIDRKATIYVEGDNTWIQNEDGVIIASSANGDFDSIVEYIDGYYELYRDTSDFDSTGSERAILYIDGTWKCDYISDFLDIYGFRYFGNGVWGHGLSSLYDSMGGWNYTYTTYRFMSFETESEFLVERVSVDNASVWTWDMGTAARRFGGHESPNVVFNENVEYTYLVCENDDVSIVGYGGVIATLGEDVEAIGCYSDGGFIYYQNSELKFFDCQSKVITTICKDSDRIVDSDVTEFKFVDGQATISLQDADGNTYTAVVDKQGNYLVEPYK